jgi:hypothetical protein
MRRSLSGACLTALTTLVATGVSHADVTMEQRMTVEGAGLMSAANMSGTTRTTISGEHSRSDSDLQLQSRVVRMLAHGAGGPSADIVLLDQDKIYHLDLKKKTYSETTFAELRNRFQQATEQTKENPQQNPQPVDDSQCEWLDPKVQVNQTGEKATIAGFEAQRLTISASQPCKNRKTGAICEMALGLDEWLAPQFTAGEEASRFQRAYAQKMGFDTAYSRDVSERAQKLFARYKGVWSELATKMKDVKGYPVKMSFALAFGGQQCKDNNAGTQQTADESSSQSSQSPPTSPGGLVGQLGGKLAGALLHRKKEPPADKSSGDATAAANATAAPASALPPGLVPLVTLTSELVSVSQEAVSPAVFALPADFKKVDEGRK